MGKEPTNSSSGALWSELKRRRVIRVIAIYAVVGWVVIEVASTVLPNLNLPEWTVTLVTILIVLGFPITVIMAWVFDIGTAEDIGGGGSHRACRSC